MNWLDLTLLVAMCSLFQLLAVPPLKATGFGVGWLSGHFVHVNWTHFGLDVASFVVLALVFTQINRLWWWALTLSSALAISFVLVSLGVLVELGLVSYAGLSGVLHALAAALGVLVSLDASRQRSERLIALLLLAGTLIKVSMETLHGGAATEQLIQAPVVWEAHRIGAGYGLVYGLFFHLGTKICSKQAVKV